MPPPPPLIGCNAIYYAGNNAEFGFGIFSPNSIGDTPASE
jgi:hypothetical protein